jgi:hypothetical protein
MSSEAIGSIVDARVDAPARRRVVDASLRPPLGRELLLAIGVVALYSAVAGLHLPGRRAAADLHALQVLHVERLMHLDVERALNDLLVPHRVLRTLANYEYATSYVVAAFGTLFWVLARRPGSYRWARTSFVLINLGGVTTFALWPVTPPRLLPGYTDTVLLDHTQGSWGSPLVAHADQLAAMPSLHVAWAVWVSAVLARTGVRRRWQVLSAAHVALTVAVIAVTANHWLLDAVAGAALVLVCGRVTDAGYRIAAVSGERVPAEDAFFLHVETPQDPQHVGGVIVLDAPPAGQPSQVAVQQLVRRALPDLPRLTQQLAPGGWWRPARWQPAGPLDWSWHVPCTDLRGGGQAALERLVAEIAATPLPRDRPLWRLHVVHSVDERTWAVVVVMHHVVADGLGTVSQVMHLLEPPLDLQPPPAPAPGRLKRVGAIVLGLGLLAVDALHPPKRVDGRVGGERRFAGVSLPLAEVKAAARSHGVRLSDVLLTAVAGGLARTTDGLPSDVRVTVPLVVRPPGAAATGNLTAAAFVDLPVDPVATEDRLAVVRRRSGRLRSPGRVLCSRWVMQGVGRALPPGLHARFARTVYGPGFFTGIVSNMPGPTQSLRLLGSPLRAAYPLLPLAPQTPLVVGALGVGENLCLGIVTDDRLVDADRLGAAIAAEVAALRG